MFPFEQDSRLWFCTNNTKDVYKDMQENPAATMYRDYFQYKDAYYGGYAVTGLKGNKVKMVFFRKKSGGAIHGNKGLFKDTKR